MIKEAIDKLVNRKDLSEQEAEEVMMEIMEGKALPIKKYSPLSTRGLYLFF